MSFPVPTQETLEQIARASEKAGLVTLVHANSLEAQEHVVGTGINIIAHGLWNWGPLSKSKGLPPRITKLLDEVVSRKIGYMPTIQVIGGTQALSDPKFLDDPNLARVLPRELVDYYRSPQGKWFRDTIEQDEGVKLTYETHKPILSRVERVTKYLADKNANLLFGTDTPSSPTYGNPPGYNGFLEIKRWFSSGVSLKQILYSATLANAQALRLDSSIGTIEKNKLANLLLLQKNPYENVEAYDQVDMVILRSKAISRNTLQVAHE